MDTPKIFESEYRFCLILWEHEPVGSGELVRLCGEQLGWKPTTVYTVIKRLSERGVQAAEIDDLVEKKFEGSLPAFVAAFTKHHNISKKEIDAVQQMIDRYRDSHKENNENDQKEAADD